MLKKFWKPFVIVLVGVMVCAVAYGIKGKERSEKSSPDEATKSGEVERQITEADVPAAALAAFKKMAAGAKFTEFAEEIEHGHTFYEGSWKNPSGANMDVLVTPTGDLVEIEEIVGADQVPAAVLAVARKAAGKDTQLTFEKKTTILYEVRFQKDNRQNGLLLSPDGRRIEEEAEKGKQDEDEEEVSIGQVPEAVKATILEHAKGGKIEKIERENEDDKVIYEAEIVIGDKEIELKIDSSGKLLSKEVQDEDDDDNDEDN